MHTFRSVRFAAFFLLVLSLVFLPGSASANDEHLLRNVNISVDGKIVAAFEYEPAYSTYNMYLAKSATVDVAIYAANNSVLVTIGNESSMGQLVHREQISSNSTIQASGSLGNRTQYMTVKITMMPDDNNTDDDNKNSGTDDDNKNTDNKPGDNSDNSGTDPGGDDGTTDPPQLAGDPTGDFTNTNQTALLLQIDSPLMRVNGVDMLLDTAPWLLPPGHTLVPVRFIAESLGGTVGWDEQAQRVDIWLDEQYFALTIGELVPGTNVSAMIKDNRTFVPLRYVMENFGASVEWIESGKYIFILYPA